MPKGGYAYKTVAGKKTNKPTKAAEKQMRRDKKNKKRPRGKK